MTDRAYLLGGQRVRVLIWPNQKRKDLPASPPWFVGRLNAYPPRNVLVEHEDGTRTVRPFRGLRRADA